MAEETQNNQILENQYEIIGKILSNKCCSHADLAALLEVSTDYVYKALYCSEEGKKFKAELIAIKQKSRPNAKFIGRLTVAVKILIIEKLKEIGEI